MKRKFTIALVVASFLTLAPSLNTPANAQITISGGELLTITGTLTATQVRKLNATPVEVVTASGSGKAIQIESYQLMLDWNSIAYDNDAGGEDFRLINSTGASASHDCDNNTCLNVDAVADDFGWGSGPSSLGTKLIAASAIRITILNGEIAAADDDANGNSPIHYLIRYRIVTLDIS